MGCRRPLADIRSSGLPMEDNIPIQSFYTSPSPYTRPSLFADILRTSGDCCSEIFAFIKSILIHPLDAKYNGIKADYKAVLRKQVFIRSVDEFLRDKKIKDLIKKWSNGEVVDMHDKAIFICVHHAVLFTTILRLQQKAVRPRVVYASYISADSNIPHWVCEVFSPEYNSWHITDPDRELEDVDKSRLKCPGNLWLEARAGLIDPHKMLFYQRKAFDALKYDLLDDINCLMKNEVLNYDWRITRSGQIKPAVFSKAFSRLSEEELDLLDTLAIYSLDPDSNFINLKYLYDSYVKEENKRPAGQP